MPMYWIWQINSDDDVFMYFYSAFLNHSTLNEKNANMANLTVQTHSFYLDIFPVQLLKHLLEEEQHISSTWLKVHLNLKL